GIVSAQTGPTLMSSKTCLKAGSGATHIVRYVSRKGSHYLNSPLIGRRYFLVLSTRVVRVDTSVPDTSLLIARRAAFLRSMILTETEDGKIFVHVDPAFPDAWRREPYYSQPKAHVPVEIRIGS